MREGRVRTNGPVPNSRPRCCPAPASSLVASPRSSGWRSSRPRTIPLPVTPTGQCCATRTSRCWPAGQTSTPLTRPPSGRSTRPCPMLTSAAAVQGCCALCSPSTRCTGYRRRPSAGRTPPGTTSVLSWPCFPSPEPGLVQPPDQFLAAHRRGPGGDDPLVHALGDVVVVAFETSARDAHLGGERMQLFQRFIGD